MRTRIATVLVLGGAFLLVGALHAQSQAPQPQLEYGPPITNEQAKAVAAAAVAEAKKNNWRMAIAIVGPAAALIYFERMDGAQLASTEMSQAKARISVVFRRPSRGFAEEFSVRNPCFIDILRA